MECMNAPSTFSECATNLPASIDRTQPSLWPSWRGPTTGPCWWREAPFVSARERVPGPVWYQRATWGNCGDVSAAWTCLKAAFCTFGHSAYTAACLLPQRTRATLGWPCRAYASCQLALPSIRRYWSTRSRRRATFAVSTIASLSCDIGSEPQLAVLLVP